jgi:dihydrofolate synthase/folylpolyglutamate synthase
VHRGRAELIDSGGRTWLLDVAHNPAGVASLAETLDALDLAPPLVALVGILADKDWGAMLAPLLERCEHVVLTQPPTAPLERRWDPAAVAATLTGAPSLRAQADFTEALHEAARLAGAGTVVVTGSVHTVGGAMKLLGVSPLG